MRVIRRRALCIEQTKSGPLYLFTLRADEIFDVAEVTRINRSRSNELIGYQRAEVRQHVEDILEYLNGDDVLFPNSIILALCATVRFRRSRGPENDDGLAKAGLLEIPLPGPDGPRPAWIVDGQQRALAAGENERRDLPVPISAFVAETVGQQRDQFLRINNTKPLPRGLVAELLPEVSIPLPKGLAAKQVPSEICGLLNDQPDSPFCGLIRRASTPRGSGAVITDTSVMDMLRESITSPSGCLFPYRNLATGETDFEAIWRIVVIYWSGVQAAFPEAWGRPPEESRLMHGVGIRAMGRLMDKVMGSVHPADPDLASHVERAMARITPSCHWTSGTWDELSLHWNDVENTNRNQRLLTNLLVRIYFGAGEARSGFFFPDSQDQVDPSFDFKTEQRSIYRVRQRDDRYADEVIQPRPYDGLLVSKPIVDGLPGASGKYTIAQRNRLYREGARRFFRLSNGSSTLRVMGDCGAFTYVREHEPLYTVDEVIDFYDGCQFDIGISPDHVVFGYDATLDEATPADVPEDWRFRQQLTASLASDFLAAHKTRKCTFEPVAVAHGWSPQSYAAGVQGLQKVGYRRIAMGGMVPLKTPDILDSLKAVRRVLGRRTDLHLLGVTRTAHVQDFARYGVTSFDSTSPFMQAFKDDKDNYYALDRTYVAIRVPQVDGNTKLRSMVTAGAVDQRQARRLERLCLDRLRKFDSERCSTAAVIDAVCSYSALLGDTKDRSATYTETLEARPWRSCTCTVCAEIGVEVIIFRGADRNRRRGFHNLSVFARRLSRDLKAVPSTTRGARRA